MRWQFVYRKPFNHFNDLLNKYKLILCRLYRVYYKQLFSIKEENYDKPEISNDFLWRRL